jgi:hypothetical protein
MAEFDPTYLQLELHDIDKEGALPRYHFTSRTACTFPTGKVELADVGIARAEAVRLLAVLQDRREEFSGQRTLL